MGYPKLFESGASCVLIGDVNMGWLNQLSEDLTDVMDNAAAIADSPSQRVVFVDPQPKFTGHNLCTSQSAINGLTFTLTPGDQPLITVPVPGPNFGMNASQQSVHPNSLGTDYYAAAVKEGLVGVYP